tara:strand:- start:277 stop:648 length:372 start_codon:yes stop_codon:yes gene_type:complete
MDNQDCKYTKTVNQSEGQIVSSTTDYDCKTTPTVIVKENSPTVIYRTGTTVSSPVTTTRVVSSTPVYHNNHQTTNIITDIAKEIFFGGAAHRQVSHNGWVIQVPNRKKGACYATDDLRGTVCY